MSVGETPRGTKAAGVRACCSLIIGKAIEKNEIKNNISNHPYFSAVMDAKKIKQKPITSGIDGTSLKKIKEAITPNTGTNNVPRLAVLDGNRSMIWNQSK